MNMASCLILAKKFDPMAIQVSLFAAFAEFVGKRELSIEYRPNMTCQDVWEQIRAQNPKITSIPVLFAINDEYVPHETPLKDKDRLMVFPPLSGGSSQYITSSPISVSETLEKIQDEDGGGEAVFIGRVRRNNEAKRVRHLYYECHIPMAEKEISKILEEMHSSWPLKKVQVQHRIGKLEVGEIAVVICVSAEHRREALEACRYGIDELKHRVPIWKKEVTEDGEEWIGACESHP
jgi:molybdopterin synthase catalytic subunit/molybdopterin converting factor small subunit